jgi:hypothetical protein
LEARHDSASPLRRSADSNDGAARTIKPLTHPTNRFRPSYPLPVADDPTDVPRWQVHGERILYDNPWVRLTQVEVEPPDGRRWWHHVVRLRPIAAAVVLNDQDQVLMLWRHRFVPDSFGWELPGGIVAAGETGLARLRARPRRSGWRPSKSRAST